MEITIDLNEKQEKFLKEFASKHYEGAIDNLCTRDAFHVVQTKRKNYIPYHEDLTDWFGGLPIEFCADDAHESWYTDEVELVNDHLDDNDIEGANVISFDEAYLKDIEGVDGEEHSICSYKDYFEAYRVEVTAISWIQEYYEPVAYFFILDEAKRYIEYQRHNLRFPRTYTYSAGYSNYGDFVPFRNLLLQMGEQLNKEDMDNDPKGNYVCINQECGYSTALKLPTEQEADEKLSNDGGYNTKKETRYPKCKSDSLQYLG